MSLSTLPLSFTLTSAASKGRWSGGQAKEAEGEEMKTANLCAKIGLAASSGCCGHGERMSGGTDGAGCSYVQPGGCLYLPKAKGLLASRSPTSSTMPSFWTWRPLHPAVRSPPRPLLEEALTAAGMMPGVRSGG